MNQEVLSGIRVLVALAKADGRLHDNEAVAIENALEGADLGDEISVDDLLRAEVDLDAEMAKIVSPEVKRRTYDAACAMVYVDGDADETERRIIDKLRHAWEPKTETSTAVRVTKALQQDWLPSTIQPIADPTKRNEAIDAVVLRACVRATILGAIPVPFVGEFLVSFVGIQALQSIGAFYGHDRDATFWKAFAGNFVGATAARVAVMSLMKLVPGWGSVVGASGAYASTWAMTRATRLYFEKGTSMAPAALREAFKEARKEGLQKAREASSDIDAETARLATVKEKLDAELASGAISEEQYAERIARS